MTSFLESEKDAPRTFGTAISVIKNTIERLEARFGSQPDAKVLVAEIKGEVVGVLCVQIIPLFHLSATLKKPLARNGQSRI
jgi:hypothetical protein